MLEKFKQWMKLKFEIHNKSQRPPFFNEREIWWCQFGQNIGDEQNGAGDQFMRPVLIIRKFNSHICLACPTSRQLKESKYYQEIEYNETKYSVLISQIRTIDVKRLKKKVARLSFKDFNKVKNSILINVFKQKIDSQDGST